MCGIYGTVDWNGPVDPAVLDVMGGVLRHRGPDACGQHIEPGVALGCRRLSIVDVPGGRQPFRSEDGAVVVVCNGEIFNYPELRRRLEKRHRFVSDCDVEVIPHLYEECGMGMLDELNGQFAVCLLDRRRRRLFLARDHFGICPLYYRASPGGLRFASEAKAILACEPASRSLDLAGLDQALVLPTVVAPRTMFEGVRAVRPGHYLEVDPQGTAEREYWDLVYPDPDGVPDAPSPPGAAADRRTTLVRGLRTAVRRRLQADVPIGLYVSGGLDSALVAALAAEARDPAVTRVFSVGFEQAELDESRYQDLVATGLDYPRCRVEVSVPDLCDRLEQTVWHAEVPMRESYNVASLLLAEAAGRHGVRVVLSGEGADEMFAGYSGYRFDAVRAGRRAEPVPAVERAARETMWGDPGYGWDLTPETLRSRQRLYSPELRVALPEFDCTRAPLVDGARLRGRHIVHKRSYLDVKLRMTDHLLGDHGDRMTMAASVEGRYPFLDLDFVRLAMDVPPAEKLRQLEEKYVLKQAASGLVPDAVTWREKFPFTAPGSPYLVRDGAEFVQDWLSPATLRSQGLFDVAEVRRLHQAYLEPGYRPETPLRTDWLMLVLTTTILNQGRTGPGSHVGPRPVGSVATCAYGQDR